jgi:phage protein U
MMMTLDLFVFEIGSLPYQQLARQTEWRYALSERFNARPSMQYVGPGADRVTLSGKLYPGIAGRFSALDTIRAMAAAGTAYLLMDGLGNLMGSWVIKSLSDNRTTFFVDGVARTADFSIELECVGD